MQWILIPFGWCFIVAMLIAVAVPYIRRRADLFTTWNLFLLGSANFLGFAAVQTGHTALHLAAYNDATYVHFVAGATLFYLVIFLTYYKFKYPARAGMRRLSTWPAPSILVATIMLPLCVVLGLGKIIGVDFQFVGQMASLVGGQAPVFIFAYLLCRWIIKPSNVGLLLLLLPVTLYAGVTSITGGAGRRDFLGIFLGAIICVYWLRLRYRNVFSNAVVFGVMGFLTIICLSAYSAIRHRDQENASSANFALDSLLLIPKVLKGDVGVTREGEDQVLGSDAVEVSLVCIHRFGYGRGEVPPQPFYTIYYVLVNPIPRAIWYSKPDALGYFLPSAVGAAHLGDINWGPGIIGHGFHEGGYHMLIFYAIFFGSIFRFFDTLLVRQSNNPYILAMFSTISGQVIAFSRGDIAHFTLMAFAGLFAGWMVTKITQILAPGRLYYPPPVPPLLESETYESEAAHLQHPGAPSAYPVMQSAS